MDDAVGNTTVNMTENSACNYSNSKTYNLVNNSVNGGYNFTGKNTVGSTTLSAINTSIGLEAGEMLGVWNRTTFTWTFWLVDYYETEATVAQWAVLVSKVEDAEVWDT